MRTRRLPTHGQAYSCSCASLTDAHVYMHTCIRDRASAHTCGLTAEPCPCRRTSTAYADLTHQLRNHNRYQRPGPLSVLPDGIVLQGFHWESSKPDCRYPGQWSEGNVSSTW